METVNIVVARVPKAVSVDELREYRDFLLDSWQRGAITLGPGMECSVQEFPSVLGVGVICGVDLALAEADFSPSGLLRDEAEPPGPPEEKLLRERDVGAIKFSGRSGEEKRAILQRLKAYREANGPGCLDAVAAKAGKGIDAMILRDMLIGAASLPIEVWRKIGKALDKLEAAERKAVADG